MLFRLEIHSHDLPIDNEPGFTMTLAPGSPEQAVVNLIPVSNYDPETEEDIPSLLIRCEIDLECQSVLADYIATNKLDVLPPTYNASTPQLPATAFLRRSALWSSLKRLSSKAAELSLQVHAIDNHLSNQTLRVANLLRWRFHVLGPSNLTEKRTLLCSEDGRSWSVLMSTEWDWTLRFQTAAKINAETELHLQHMLDSSVSEPLAHDLMREALIQRDENPRSALVMAVGAAEIGFKRLISTLVPAATFLVEEVQAPSLEKLMRKYFPVLSETSWIHRPIHLPIQEVVKPISDAVTHRNTIVHKPDSSVRQMEASAFLKSNEFDTSIRAISDLLFIIDYCLGSEWAVENLSARARERWQAAII